jgi:hypothetical protein
MTSEDSTGLLDNCCAAGIADAGMLFPQTGHLVKISARARGLLFRFSLVCLGLGMTALHLRAQSDDRRPHQVILFPGLSDDGTKGADLVGFARSLLNPWAQATITVTPGSVAVQNFRTGTVDKFVIQDQSQAENLLTDLRKSGLHDFIVNVDMDIGFLNFPLRKSAQSAWATSQGNMWNKALRDVFKGSIVGSLSHSFGNDPAGNCILNGVPVDYAVMASPGAKRTTLNQFGARTELLVVTAKDDFHGPTEFDGPVNFSHIRLLRASNPHNAVVTKGVLQDAGLQFQTNVPNPSAGSTASGLIQAFVSAQTHSPDRASNPGGVRIAPEPTGTTKDLKGEKDKILESRPGKDSLSWPVKPPEKKKL